MITNEVRLTGLKQGEVREVAFLSCTHIGSMHCSKGSIRKAVQYIKENNVRWFHLGDLCEYIPRNDRHYDPSIIPREYLERFLQGETDPFKELPMIQTKEAVEMFAPIAHLCLGIHGGNHEDKILRYCPGTFDPIQEFIERMQASTDVKIPNLGYGQAFSWLKWVDNNHVDSLIINTSHGVNKVHRLEDKFKYFDCQVIARGHNHAKLETKSVPGLFMAKKSNKIIVKDRNKWALHCGSFLKTYGEGQPGYGEKKDYEPAPIGFIVLKIRFKPYMLKPETVEYTSQVTEAA